MEISILGLGWVGYPLALELIARGHQITGTVTSEQKKKILAQENLKIEIVKLPKVTLRLEEVLRCDVLIFAIPPGVRKDGAEEYQEKIQVLQKGLMGTKMRKLIHLSSTAIYSKNQEKLTEVEADTSSIHYWAEKELRETAISKGIVFQSLRCGGLMGYDRYPCKYYSETKPVLGANHGVNYIHRDDLLQILVKLIEEIQTSGTWNAVADLHPSRKKVIQNCIKQKKTRLPAFVESLECGKTVSNEKLKRELNFKFKYFDPAKFPY